MPRLALVLSIVLGAVLGGACGDDGMATVDAPPDPCMPEMQFTGDVVDWDSSETAFMGVAASNFVLRSDPTKNTLSAPNGRFILCIPPEDGFVDITPDPGRGYIGGQVVVKRATIQAGARQSYRSFTMTRSADFGFSATKAHVYVHVDTPAGKKVATTAAASVKKHWDGTTWADGDAGTDVYLGNIDATGMTNLSVGGSSVGMIPLVAGQFTYITVR